MTALLCLNPTARANPRHDPASGTFPRLTLPGILRGQAAIDALGNNLPAVAASYGHTPDQLRGLLQRDKSLRVDESGRLLYIEETLPAGAGTLTAGATTAAGAPYPLENTFLLHSRPGAKRVIYLDFNGYVLTGTAWNSGTASTINCPPFDKDGIPSSFSDAEKTIIQGVWQRVAEDYLPFDVDVTTEDGGEALLTRLDSSDEFYGVRVLISPISSYFGNYGGIAYVGVFDYVGDYYKPALVFPEKLGNDEKNIAEAAAHEAGHTLGLSHDGTTTGTEYYGGSGSGETGWAPIMGVGYYQNLTQWSKGEYTSANNQEDDLAVMQNNGIALRTDDHGNTVATATLLPFGSTLNASGIIERNSDVDAFGFNTEAGTISLTIAPAPKGPNLDIRADLYNASGTLVASSSPSGTLAATFNLTLPGGTYYVLVRGTGQGDPLTGYSNYASLGAYTLTGTIVATSGNLPPLASASASPPSGFAPLAVIFDGTSSTDPENATLSFVWNFGDGTGGLGPSVAHTFTKSGLYNTSLTVSDPGGLSAQTTLQVNVQNTSPTATLNASSTSGMVPLTVSFSATGSKDPDGTISSYQWNFGDGTSASGSTVSHTYLAAGTFPAKLTVTDNGGATGTASISISVASNPNYVLHVASLSMSTTSAAAGTTAYATVVVADATNAVVPNATVTGTWSGAVSGTSSATTDNTGKVVLSSKRYKKGTATFTITNVSKAGYTYDSTKNTATRVP